MNISVNINGSEGQNQFCTESRARMDLFIRGCLMWPLVVYFDDGSTNSFCLTLRVSHTWQWHIQTKVFEVCTEMCPAWAFKN